MLLKRFGAIHKLVRIYISNVTLSQTKNHKEYIIYSGGDDMKRKAVIDKSQCVACGCCVKVCPKGAVSVPHGINAVIDETMCVGCGKCAKECPASIITLEERDNES